MPNPLRVLHLEDSPRDAEVIRHQLEEGGVSCHVLLVDSKDRFEAALTQEPFDLILCDHNLSGYDGISALTYAQQARPDVPVIMISGTVGDEEAVTCLHLGATDYLLKDRLERLASAVERTIQDAQTRRARRLTEAKLQQSEQLNRNLVEHLPQRMFVKDLNCKYVFCNSLYARDLGMEPTQIVGQDDFAFFSRARAEEYRAEDRQVMSEGKIRVLDGRHTVAGLRQWTHTVKIPYRDEHGEIIGVIGLVEDISERKLIEEQRERLAALVDASPDFIGCADPQTTQVTYINTGGRKMCGIGDDEEIGELTLGDVHPAWMTQQLAEVTLASAIRDGLWQGDGAFLHRDGHEIPVSMAVLPHRGADGQVDFVYTVSRDITERKRAEQALRSERDRAQRFLDTADVILLKLDLEGRIVLVNRYGCSLLGWTADELLGRDWIETCLPVRIREESDGKRRQLLGGDLSIIENPVVTKSGEERLVEWRNRLLRDDQGHLIGSFSSGTDITERNQAVDALRTAAERTRFALEAAGVGIWDIDFTSGVLHWSETLELQYGLLPGTFGGTFEAFIECIHPDDRASVLETVGKAMKAGADFTVQHRSIWPDGTVRWLSGAGRIYLGADGEPVRGVGISQDVTGRRQADETRARLAAIVDSTDDAIYSTTLDDTILTWNAGAERLYGCAAAEVIGRNQSVIVPAGASVGRTAAMLAKAGRGEAGEPFETKGVRKDGLMIDVSLMISPITDSTGRVTGASSIARDIGNQKKAEAELRRLNLEIQLQRMRVFKATIRTVQDIVNNLLNGFQLVRLEGEGHLPVELLSLVDHMVHEAGAKLKTLGDLEAVNEKEMAIGTGIDYPGAGS
ncbi:MAG TPA: PAS domain S-box protein [Vicinamibacterales bacterium]|nr:PAS domain S-box protein [Vicinamibacterales bacterium]